MPTVSLADRLNGKLHRLFVIGMIAWVVLMGFRPMMDNVDLGWHVAQGRWMVQHANFYRHDAFNYPNLGHPVVDEYPLFQLVLYAAWSLGWWGPCLLTSFAYAVLVSLFFLAARAFRLSTPVLLCFAVAVMFLYLQIIFPLRPHLFTYIGIAAFGIGLLRNRDTTDWITLWPLALYQVAWVNSHSGFIVGPAMVGLFGAEMALRRGHATRSIPWLIVRTWLCGFLFILLACFVNPFGWARFSLPFYQDSLESIRAYVGEMEPLSGGLAALFGYVTAMAAFVVAAGLLMRRGATCYSFLLLALFFYVQAHSVQKAWPVFGVFVPLLILGSAVFSTGTALPPKVAAWLGVVSHFMALIFLGMALTVLLNGSWPTSLQAQWREHRSSRTELSFDATDWMKAHGVEGRLFHRCEDGGWLQMAGFDHGETFSDTGFGKYDEAFIHEVGLVNERPALVPRFLAAYRPDFVVCSNFCYQWPYYLRRNGCRLIFYTPNSSIWICPGEGRKGNIALDDGTTWPTVDKHAIMAAFDRDLADNGMPSNSVLLGRNLIALNSLGLEDFAFAKLTGLPKDDHLAAWYWEAARLCCFADPGFSAEHRDALFHEAESAGAVTTEFRAYYKYYAAGDVDGALKILRGIPPASLGNYVAELLLRIELERKQPEALTLARRTDCFDLRNGRHWMYLAQAEEQFGSLDAAGVAWRKAVFYYPDDPALLQAASDFESKHNDAALAQDIAASEKVYGAVNP